MIIGGCNVLERVLIMAEIGNNHEGSFDAALKMVEAAACAGADAVKFQRIVPEELVSSDQTARVEQLRKFSLSDDQFAKLARCAQENGVLFMATPFDVAGVRILDPFVPAFKIASSDVDFFPLLEAVTATKKPVLISGGTASKEDFLAAKKVVEQGWKNLPSRPGLAFLHCVSKYPTPDEEAGLETIRALKPMADVAGYSDHTLGIDASVLAVGVGARIIEKHFTLDKNRSSFRDHQLSADPVEFRNMVSAIRKAEKLISAGSLLEDKERGTAFLSIRRSAAAGRDLPMKTVLSSGDLSWVRPGTGFRPSQQVSLIGRQLKRDMKRGELIRPEDVI